jgi:hypothetical protein
MAKSNELFVMNKRQPDTPDVSLKTVRGRFVSLRTPEDVSAAKYLELPVMVLRAKMTDRGAKWESRTLVAANDNPYDVSPFVDREQAREIAERVSKRAEEIRAEKNNHFK